MCENLVVIHGRLAGCAGMLLATAALGHVVKFQFLVPDGTARSSGGVAVVQWLAGPDPTGSAEFSLYAARDGIPPFGIPRYDATIDATSRVPVDGIQAWDVGAIAPGCYQPFAEVDDQIEGVTWRPAPGMLSVTTDGGNVPPVLWVSTPANAPSDGGLLLSYRVDDPDDASKVSIEWVLPDGGSGLVAAELTIPLGGASANQRVSAAQLPAGESCYLRVKVRSDDGRTCTAWWSGRFTGAADAGLPDAGSESPDAGQTPSRPQGCGCSAASGWLALALTAGGFVRRRRG